MRTPGALGAGAPPGRLRDGGSETASGTGRPGSGCGGWEGRIRVIWEAAGHEGGHREGVCGRFPLLALWVRPPGPGLQTGPSLLGEVLLSAPTQRIRTLSVLPLWVSGAVLVGIGWGWGRPPIKGAPGLGILGERMGVLSWVNYSRRGRFLSRGTFSFALGQHPLTKVPGWGCSPASAPERIALLRV